jgi:hypothetical protein
LFASAWHRASANVEEARALATRDRRRVSMTHTRALFRKLDVSTRTDARANSGMAANLGRAELCGHTRALGGRTNFNRLLGS